LHAARKDLLTRAAREVANLRTGVLGEVAQIRPAADRRVDNAAPLFLGCECNPDCLFNRYVGTSKGIERAAANFGQMSADVRTALPGAITTWQGIGPRGGENRTEWEKADPATLKQTLKVLWIGCGAEDPGYRGVKAMDELLTNKKVKHVWNESGVGHSRPNWQVYLSKYAAAIPRLIVIYVIT
jgi:hypothetical protein